MFWSILIACVLACLLWPVSEWPILPCGAQETGKTGQTDLLPVSVALQSPDLSGPADPRELEAFLDPFFTRQLNTGRFPGAVVVVVKDGGIFFAKGYGYANREQQTRVVPESTIFRVVSDAHSVLSVLEPSWVLHLGKSELEATQCRGVSSLGCWRWHLLHPVRGIVVVLQM